MSDNNRRIEYGLRITVEYSDESKEPLTLIDVQSETPFLNIQAGDIIWPKGFIGQNSMVQPPPFLYNDALTVKAVKHFIWEFRKENEPMLHHGVEVVIQDPYDD
jgi:hypothetical protein